MIRNVLVVLIIVCFTSCENQSNVDVKSNPKFTEAPSRYPVVLERIFDNHGGLNNWKSTNKLHFSIENEGILEKHSIDLNSRKTLILADDYTLGFDGKNTWIKDDDNNFKSNPKFYYNLMFYFYAMPFVISDPGIFYTERKDTTLEFQSYGTLHIGFSRSVGASPQDEYIIYYNKKTMEMAWLGYTVTYFDRKRSTEWHFIKYDNWQTINGLKLPKTLIWYETKNDKAQNPKNKVEFFDVRVTSETTNPSFFQPIKGSVFVE